MNRFVKQNLLLITIMSISSVIILALLIYSGIVYFQVTQCIQETEKLRSKIGELIRNSPAPVEENKPLIQKDIDFYQKLNKNVNQKIGRPYQKAADRFVEILMDVKKGESIEEARKKFVEDYNNSVFKKEGAADQQLALEVLRVRYGARLKNALSEFVKMVTPLTQEPDLVRYGEAFAFSAIGIPRKMQTTEQLQEYSRKYQEKIQQIMGQKIRPTAEAFGFSFLANPQATFKTEGEEGSTSGPFRLEDVPVIVRHWDIIGDICKRISSVNIKSLNFFYIRGINKENGAYDATFTQRGNFNVSHYAFEVSAPLKEIRALTRAFDYDPKIGRFYAIRSVFVYANDVEIALVDNLLKPKKVEEEKKDAAAPVRRGRRRGAVVEEAPAQPTMDKAAELQAKMREEFEKREKSLPFYQRSGYGEVKLAGSDEYRAVFDIEYIELGNAN